MPPQDVKLLIEYLETQTAAHNNASGAANTAKTESISTITSQGPRQ
jgi:hypothetical protein